MDQLASLTQDGHLVTILPEGEQQGQGAQGQQISGEAHKLCAQIVRSISSHTSIEEQHLHANYEKYLGEQGKLYYDESLQMDRLDKQLLAALEANPIGSEKWSDAFRAFRRSLFAHIELEEKTYWPALSAKMPVEEQAALARKLESAEKTAPLHPHPGGPSSATAAKVMHPVVGMLDRATESAKAGVASAKEAVHGFASNVKAHVKGMSGHHQAQPGQQ